MRNDAGASVIQLLLETGVLDQSDIKAVQTEQKEALLNLLLEKRVLLHSEREDAKEILTELMESSSRTRCLKAQAALVTIITGNLHRRMDQAGEKVRKHKERVTSGHYPVVTAALKSKG